MFMIATDVQGHHCFEGTVHPFSEICLRMVCICHFVSDVPISTEFLEHGGDKL